MAGKLHYIIYISTEAVRFTDEVLEGILRKSRRNNSASNITGILLYSSGNIMQLLEGDEQDVRNTYSRIQKDPRHRSVTTIIDRPLKSRNFAEWSMAFYAGNATLFSLIEGYKDPDEVILPGKTSDDSIITILKTFIAVNPSLKNI